MSTAIAEPAIIKPAATAMLTTIDFILFSPFYYQGTLNVEQTPPLPILNNSVQFAYQLF
jgi:hypothetical protein